MTSTKAKGQKKELEAKHILEAEGWITVFRTFTIKMGPFYKGIDFADLFDLVAVRTDDMPALENAVPTPHWLFLSVKGYSSAGNIAETREKIRRFATQYGLPNMDFQQWLWKKPGNYGRGKARIFCKGEFKRELIA